MPRLSEVSYSLEETVAAIRDYFEFLTRVYLDESYVHLPPEGGWPEITPERLRGLGKTDDVVQLLRHMPYIQDDENTGSRIYAGPCMCEFYKWPVLIRNCERSTNISKDFEDMRILTEPYGDWDKGLVPPHMVGLITIETYFERFLLDTKHGVIYWFDCPGKILDSPTREPILDDLSDPDCSEEETPKEVPEWRTSPAWSVRDFFELLKDCFRELRTIPLSYSEVFDLNTFAYDSETLEALSLVRDVFREHGWPDLDRYRKEDCLRAARRVMEEKLPNEGFDWQDG
ncbi:hypothetical protein VTJ04DRAFT_3120 [Mycothermus thermophilus]|uniref:uncharacterized protein n=1 Tax=Humicola insolens TaxID=85995 RepID=UPI0037439889